VEHHGDLGGHVREQALELGAKDLEGVEHPGGLGGLRGVVARREGWGLGLDPGHAPELLHDGRDLSGGRGRSDCG
jgi:hypothetical protein